MRVFVTGASGWIGSAVVDELLAADHEVLGLARSDASVAAVEAKGAAVQRGDLDDLDSLRAGAEKADAVIHLAFKHDFDNFAASGIAERAAVQAFGDVLAGEGRSLLLASGVAVPGLGRPLTERDPSPFEGPEAPRGGTEPLALSFAARGIRPVALRFAPTVHGDGDHGFIAELVRIARAKGVAGYLGEGSNRWPAVHRLDAAHMVRLALETSADVPVVHGVAEEGISTRVIADAIGRGLGVPAVSIDPQDAAEHFGWLGGFFGMDAPTSNAITRAALGWEPRHATLLEDLAGEAYFRV